MVRRQYGIPKGKALENRRRVRRTGGGINGAFERNPSHRWGLTHHLESDALCRTQVCPPIYNRVSGSGPHLSRAGRFKAEASLQIVLLVPGYGDIDRFP